MSSGSKILGFIGVLAVMASSLAFVLFTGKEVPTVGLVAPVFAAAAGAGGASSAEAGRDTRRPPGGRAGHERPIRLGPGVEGARQPSPSAARYRSNIPLAHGGARRVAGGRYHRRPGSDRSYDAVPSQLDLERDDYAGGDGYRVGVRRDSVVTLGCRRRERGPEKGGFPGPV